MDFIAELDTDLFFFLNGLHAPWLDQAMFYLSKTATSIPVYGFLLYLVIVVFNKRSWIPLLCVALCILCTDRITSGLTKPAFERLRPTHEPLLMEKVHTVNDYRGGKFGFASSHAANTFGVAMFMFLLLRKDYRWMGWLFAFAGLISYTRIYLGVHYPGDIVAGATLGLLFGWIFFRLNNYLFARAPGNSKSELRT